MSTLTMESLTSVEPVARRRGGWRSREAWARTVSAGFFVGLVIMRREAFLEAADGIGASQSLLATAQSGLMLLFLTLSAVFYLFIAALFVGRHAARASSDGFWPTFLAFGGTWGAAPLVILPIVNRGPGWTLAATLLMTVGMASSCAALFSLGRHFGIRARARGVVTGGLYGRIRHPLYLFESIAQLGLLLVVFSPLAVAVFAVYVMLQIRRAVAEERLLAATFPAYREYQARTARFIPGVI